MNSSSFSGELADCETMKRMIFLCDVCLCLMASEICGLVVDGSVHKGAYPNGESFVDAVSSQSAFCWTYSYPHHVSLRLEVMD